MTPRKRRACNSRMRRQSTAVFELRPSYEDELAAAFWEAAGYPRDREIGRRVRNL